MKSGLTWLLRKDEIMKITLGKRGISALFFLGIFILSGCATVMDQVGQMVTFAQCQFRLASVAQTTLAGVPLQGGKVSDISLVNLAKLQSAFSKGTLPLEFTVNMEVRNPNSSKAGMSRMAWNLLVDGTQLTSGLLEKAVEIGPSKTGALPMAVSLDLKKVLSGKSLDSMINLALGVAGEGTEPSKMTLQVKPSMTVAGQVLIYPGYVNVTHEFPAK